jgi:chemotaxis protein methyltransferase CheR
MHPELPNHFHAALNQFISEALGLYFPPSRWMELQRGICAAAEELGNGASPAEFASWLATGPALSQRQLDVLSTKLTVGETYFFREPRHFAALTEHILPEIAQRREPAAIRIWSAACCTGEEAYSIAIWLDRMAPAFAGRATIVGTDINPDFLRRAEAGVFGRWSFRDAPPWLMGQYFQEKREGQFEIAPRIRRMVRFMPLNLASDTFPALLTDLHAMDVIFCRNVLMYFSNEQARKTLEKFYHTQRDKGWLMVGASELFHISSSPYATVRLADAIVCLKGRNASAARTGAAAPVFPETQNPVTEASTQFPAIAAGADRQPASQVRESSSPVSGEAAPASTWAALTRDLAGRGKLQEALVSADRWIAADKLDPVAHYLRGLIFREKGEALEAMSSLRRSLYLDPHFIVAYLALGNMERDRGQKHKAHRHLANAIELLTRQEGRNIIPESDGMTAKQCLDLARALAAIEVPV